MTQNNGVPQKQMVQAFDDVEQMWQAQLPALFRELYATRLNPFPDTCDFFSLDAIARGAGRSYGMLPQYLPFGRTGEGSDTVGFYATPTTVPERWPICCWDEEERYLRPVASDFAAFLRCSVLIDRYESEEQSPDLSDRQENRIQREFAQRFKLPYELTFGALPRNDAELHARLIQLDGQNAASLCHLGCSLRARGDESGALKYFYRAVESAPWFGDSAYLAADVHRERGSTPDAIAGWWVVVQCLLPLCTRTWEWDLGADHPEAEIYEVAADALTQFAQGAEPAIKAQPLWRVVTREDPYDPEAREALGNAFLAQNDLSGAEHEYLNALTLCYGEKGRQPDRLYEALHVLYERMGRMRDAGLVQHDRALPRPAP